MTFPRRSAAFTLLIAFVLALGVLAVSSTQSRAQSDRTAALFDLLRMDEVMDIMAREGLAYGDVVAADMFPSGQGGARWKDNLARIYDAKRMRAVMEQGFGDTMSDAAHDRIAQFYRSALGQRVSELELSARAALLDKAVEDAAIKAYRTMRAAENPELDRLERFVIANDLIDSNVVGGLNSNVAFYRGLVDGGAFAFEMTDQQILTEVWSQEPDVREETIEWLYSYLALAFHPLNDADLQAYIDLSNSPEGQAFNRALFAAFDVMFEDISYELGRAAGQELSGQDI